ncbi:MAG: hypothetical protein ACR2N3_04235 [Pyrinomonadaceae bacterium]
MFSENSRKILTAAIVFAIFLPACGVWQKTENAAPTPAPAVLDEASRELPFSTKEPENYQAEIVISTFNSDEKSERKIFTARNGTRRLTIFNSGERTEISALNLDNNVSLSISQPKKIYTENKLTANNSVSPADDFLTTEWLNAETAATFEKLETENNLTKFRVRLNDSENSEILIYFDGNLKIPVKQELYSISGEQKTLTFSVEVRNFKTETDEKIFEPPKDFRKVSAKEFQEVLRENK